LRPAAECCELAVARRHRVGDEHQVQLAAFGGLRDLGVMSEIGAGVDLRVRVQPGGNVVPGRVKERTELRLDLSIGEQSGPRIGMEEGPLPGIGTGLSRRRIGGSRARRAVPSQATERRAWEVPVCPPGQTGVALSYGV
jgi:hypothetical protein